MHVILGVLLALSDPNLERWKQTPPLSHEEEDRRYEEQRQRLVERARARGIRREIVKSPRHPAAAPSKRARGRAAAGCCRHYARYFFTWAECQDHRRAFRGVE